MPLRIRLVTFAALGGALACGPAVAPAPADPARPGAPASTVGTVAPAAQTSPDPILEVVAKELDRGAIEPFWPTLPADVRAELERSAAAPKDPAARVQAARERLEGFVWDPSDPSFADRATLRRTLEGVFLAEAVALSGAGPSRAAAAAVLERFFAAMVAVPKTLELLRGSSESWSADARKALADGSLEPFERLGRVAEKMRGQHAATVLRAGEPRDAVFLLIRDVAQARLGRGDVKGARSLHEELVKRKGGAMGAEDWAFVAWGHVRAEDVPGATAAVRSAKEAASRPGTPRRVVAVVRRAEGDVGRLSALLALGAPTSVEARVKRFDGLKALGRAEEAAAVLAVLAKEAPTDGRVRVRTAVATFERMAMEGKLFEGAVVAAKELGEGEVTNKEGDYWSLLAGVYGMRVMVEALPELGKNPAAGMKRLQNLVVEQRKIALELGRYDPGRAAAILFLLDRLAPTLQKGVDLALAEAVKAIRGGFADALALRAKHKNTADVDRIVYTFAMFHADRVGAFDAVAVLPGTAAGDDPPFYVQRARTALTIATMIPDGSRLDAAKRMIEDLLPSEDADLEAQREVLLGDVEVLRARLRADGAAWAAAASHYEAGRKRLKDGRGRVANNLGWIALEQGDGGRAQELFKEATLDAKSDRRWIAYLNSALPLGQRSPESVRAVREIASATRKDGRPPIVASTWLAALSTDPAETRKAAREALEEMDAPLHSMKPDTGAHGLDSEGSFQIGLGLSSRHRFHELASYAFSSVWLMPKLPLGRKELSELAKK